MSVSCNTSPPYSVVLISDSAGIGDVPPNISGRLIVSSLSCIAIGCRSEIDGETRFLLGRPEEVDPGKPPVFRGSLITPSQKVVLRTVLGNTLLEILSNGEMSNVQVWANDSIEPDEISIGVD